MFGKYALDFKWKADSLKVSDSAMSNTMSKSESRKFTFKRAAENASSNYLESNVQPLGPSQASLISNILKPITNNQLSPFNGSVNKREAKNVDFNENEMKNSVPQRNVSTVSRQFPEQQSNKNAFKKLEDESQNENSKGSSLFFNYSNYNEPLQNERFSHSTPDLVAKKVISR